MTPAQLEQLRLWSLRHGIGGFALADLYNIVAPVVHPSSYGALPVDFRLVAESLGGALWRNNSGVMTPAPDPKKPHITPRPVRFGLGNDSAALNKVMKSSDWIGINHDGRFLAVEQKPAGWRLTPGDARGQAQYNFHERVRKLGGTAGFATEASHVLEIMRK